MPRACVTPVSVKPTGDSLRRRKAHRWALRVIRDRNVTCVDNIGLVDIHCGDEWADGWMDGRVDGWVDGRLIDGRWTCGWWTDEWVDGLVGGG